MKTSTYGMRLLREFFEFAHKQRVYWLIPLVGVLALAGALIVGGQAITPLIYTIF